MSGEAQYLLWLLRNRPVFARRMLPAELAAVDELIAAVAERIIAGGYWR